jgi:hypothetical protein
MESVCSCVLDNGHLNEHNFHREEIMYIIWSFCKQSIQRYDIFVSEMDVFPTALAYRAILSTSRESSRSITGILERRVCVIAYWIITTG